MANIFSFNSLSTIYLLTCSQGQSMAQWFSICLACVRSWAWSPALWKQTKKIQYILVWSPLPLNILLATDALLIHFYWVEEYSSLLLLCWGFSLWLNVGCCPVLFMGQLIWSCIFFSIWMWQLHIDFQMLTQACIPGINTTWS